MKIDLLVTIENVPLKEIKELFRRTECFNKEFLMDYLNLDPDEAEKLIAELLIQGFLERGHNSQRFITTSYGKRLAATRAQRITKSKAVALFNSFLDRVKYVNSQQCEYAYWVDRVVLGGSFLVSPDQSDFGDIDLFIRLKRKYEDNSKQDDLNEVRARLHNGVFSSFLSKLAWPQTEVVKFLKNKSKYLSINDDYDSHEDLEPKGSFKVIYHADSFPVAD